MYLIKTPFWLRWLYPGLVWRKASAKPVIYLTFDDGPIPEVTPFVLSVLEKYNAKATFFCIGDNIQKHPDIFQKLIEGRHAIGNHTFNHLKGWKTKDEVYLENFKLCDNLTKSKLFRPPYGRIKRSQVSKLKNEIPGLRIIMWDVLSGDFDFNLSPDKCLKNVLKATEAGSIVVFHDSLKAFERLEYVLPRALEFWKKQGYSFEKL
jgi:peptidoglycan/xylan/chitin deacetylase (PgdA/CDA1 family)